MSYRIVLYGAGIRCRILCDILKRSNIEIAAILDSNSLKWGSKLEGYTINPPDKLREFQDEHLCITAADGNAICAIREDLYKKHQYDLKKEVHYNTLFFKAYTENQELKRMILEQGNADRCNDRDTVLFDCICGLGLGGIPAWTMDICSALIKKGWDDVYLISDEGDYKVPALLRKHVLYAEIDHTEMFLTQTMQSLVRIIVKNLPCKVITSSVNDFMLAAYLVKHFRPEDIEIISVVHTSYERAYGDYLEWKECPDFYVAVSLDIKKIMMERGVKPYKITSMTCPFACERELKRTYDVNRSQPIRIGYAGRLEIDSKRMDLLLKLVETLAGRNIPFILELAGAGTAQAEMEKFTVERKLQDRVFFLGEIERKEIASFWMRQDICVNISDYEGRSISIIEAMGNGAAPVVTATSGVNEDIENGVNGYIVPVGEYMAMADQIERLENDRITLCKMGKLAHDAVYPKSLMETHLAFWEDILSRSFTGMPERAEELQ